MLFMEGVRIRIRAKGAGEGFLGELLFELKEAVDRWAVGRGKGRFWVRQKNGEIGEIGGYRGGSLFREGAETAERIELQLFSYEQVTSYKADCGAVVSPVI
jgi:hypothetical protein